MKLMYRLLCALSVVMSTTTSYAAPFMVLGRAIDVVPPDGYCALGATSIEREFFDRFKTTSEPGGQLLQVAVPCKELDQAKAGTISEFSKTANVMVIKRRGQLVLDPRSPAEFLKALSAPGPIDLAATNSKLRAALAGKNASVVLGAMTPIGTDGIAAYWSVVATTAAEGMQSRRAVSVSAAMLVNGLPLSVQSTESEGATDGPAPASVTQGYVNKIAARNGVR